MDKTIILLLFAFLPLQMPAQVDSTASKTPEIILFKFRFHVHQ